MNEMRSFPCASRHSYSNTPARPIQGVPPMSSPTEPRPTPVRNDRTHFLYIAVIVAVLLGIGVGFLFPDFAVELKPLGTGFVNLIKMMISPIIFCTLVLGIGSVRQAASVGKVGGLALVYFLVMSTVALGDRPAGRQPGPAGLRSEPDRQAARGRPEAGRRGARGHDGLPARHHPEDHRCPPLTEGEVLQTLFVALLVGFALQAMGSKGQPILRRHRSHPAAGVQGPVDDHVGRADRRVRRDRGRRRRHRRGRAGQPRQDHARPSTSPACSS